MEVAFKEKSYPANYPADALAIIDAMSFSNGRNVKILGSMSMRSQQYAGDYDLFEEVKTKGSEQEALHSLASKFKDIVKSLLSTKNIYVGDIKAGAIAEWQILNPNAGIVSGKVENYNAVECRRRIDELAKSKVISAGEAKYANSLIKDTMTPEDLIEAKKELKFHIVRWSPQEVVQGSKVLRNKKRYTLEEAFSSHALTKLDVIGFVQNNRFTDFSIIYEFFNNGKVLNDFPLNVAQSLNEDIIYYKAHGNHFKVLKRMLALAKLNKDSATVDKLVPVLNSDLGRLYLIISDVGTLIELLENERKVPMALVRFELDQMKARMGNIYNLPDFLSEEHDLVGDINAILKMTNKAQLLSRLHQIKGKMEGILNTNAKAKGGRRVRILEGGATEAERGRAAKLREKYALQTGVNAAGFPERPQIYSHLSAIIHDAEPGSVADGTSALTSVAPNQKQIVRNLANFIMNEDKLLGFPLERDPARFVNPPTADPDQIPASQRWLGYSNTGARAYEDEPLAVWRYFLMSGNATPADKALGVPAIPQGLLGLTSADKKALIPSYDRYDTQAPSTVFVPPQAPPAPPSFEEQLGALARPIPLPPARTSDVAVAQAQAVNKAEQERINELIRQTGESNAYTLLLKQKYRRPVGVDTEELARTEAQIKQLEPQLEAQRNEAMGEEDAYSKALQRQEYLESYAGREERTRLEEERAKAEAEARRREEEAKAEALRPRGEVTEAEKAEIERLKDTAVKLEYSAEAAEGAMTQIETVFNDPAKLAKIPKDIRDKDLKILLKAVKDGRIASAEMAQLAKFKADKARLEAELKGFPKGLDKVKKPNATEKKQLARIGAIDEELAYIPPDIDTLVSEAERKKRAFEKAEPQLRDLYKQYIAPKPAEEKGVNILPPSIIPESLFAEYFSDLIKPNLQGVKTDVDEISEVLKEKMEAATAFAVSNLDEMKKKGMADSELKENTQIMITAMSESMKEEFLDFFLYDLKTITVFRTLKEFRELVGNVLAGNLDTKIKGSAESFRLAIRDGVVRNFGRTKFFPNIEKSTGSVDDITMTRLGEIAAINIRLLKGDMVSRFAMSGEGVDALNNAQDLAMIWNDDGGRDEYYFNQGAKENVKTIRKYLNSISPFARNLCFLSMAYIIHHRASKGERFPMKVPDEWAENGNITFPTDFGTSEFKGKGRVRRLRGGRLRGGNLDDELKQIKVHYDKIKRGMEADLNGSWIIRDPQAKINKNIEIIKGLFKGLSKYLTVDTIAMVKEIANTPYLQVLRFLEATKAKKRQILDSFSPNDSLDLIKVIISSPQEAPQEAPQEESPSRPMTTAEARREAYR